MSAFPDALSQVRGRLAAQVRSGDPLVDNLIRKAVAAGLLLALGVAVWLLLINLALNQFVLQRASSGPGTDLILQAANTSIEEVVKFANSTEQLAEEITPQSAYPAAIDVQPLSRAGNPFGSLAAPAPAPDLGALIRQKQAPVEAPIAIRGVLGKADGTYLAVLASEGISRVVRPGDTFADWQVLAVSRDRVELKKNGKTRTIAWEGNK